MATLDVFDYDRYLPSSVAELKDPQTEIPRIAKDKRLLKQIEAAVQQIPTTHRLIPRDARELTFLEDESIHLVVPSPPYWILKNTRITLASLEISKTMKNFCVNSIKCGRIVIACWSRGND